MLALSHKAYQIQFPAFRSQDANRYVISAVAYVKRGNASDRSEMIIHAEYYHPIQNQISSLQGKTAAPIALDTLSR